MLRPWFAALTHAQQVDCIRVAEQSDSELGPDLVRAIHGPDRDFAHEVVRVLGMSGQPDLARVAADARVDRGLRDAADWWLRNGTRVAV